MYEYCPTCKAIWEEFSDATKSHVAILAKVQLAQIQQNNAVLLELEPLKVVAAERRAKALGQLSESTQKHTKLEKRRRKRRSVQSRFQAVPVRVRPG